MSIGNNREPKYYLVKGCQIVFLKHLIKIAKKLHKKIYIDFDKKKNKLLKTKYEIFLSPTQFYSIFQNRVPFWKIELETPRKRICFHYIEGTAMSP